jgi:hypothetical protein
MPENGGVHVANLGDNQHVDMRQVGSLISQGDALLTQANTLAAFLA